MSAEEEQRLADLLKRAVPEPPRQLTYEEITVPHVNRSRKSWLMPALAAAAVVVIGATLGGVATQLTGNSGTPVAPPGTSRSALTPQAPRTTPGAPTPVATASPSATPVPTIPTSAPTAVPTSTSSATAVPRKAVVVPSVIGEAATQATATLTAAGLTVTLQAQAAPSSRPAAAGIVWSQSPAAGAAVAPGTRITLFCQP